MTYLQSPALLLVATALLVALARKVAGNRADGSQRIDGAKLVLPCSVVASAIVATLQYFAPELTTLAARYPGLGVVFAAVLAGPGTVAALSLYQWAASYMRPLSIDARTTVEAPVSVTETSSRAPLAQDLTPITVPDYVPSAPKGQP